MESNSRKTQILKEIFGYDSFRKGQEEIVDQILNGRDVLAIMPTGAGKSLCYQVPALLMSGITIVVSPLISLMIDQVKALNEAGVHAAYINSALTERQITKALELAAAGRYKMIYVAPERLLTPRFLDFACHTELSMVTIDEAHCISDWGHDFRPQYRLLERIVRTLPPNLRLLATTATANNRVMDDLVDVLGPNIEVLRGDARAGEQFARFGIFFDGEREQKPLHGHETIARFLGDFLGLRKHPRQFRSHAQLVFRIAGLHLWQFRERCPCLLARLGGVTSRGTDEIGRHALAVIQEGHQDMLG